MISPLDIKLGVARAQLGTALHLFIHDKDPLSVQALACGGGELIEGLANTSNIATFSTHILSTYPEMDEGKVRKLKNQYWNAIKHYYRQNQRSVRDDSALMDTFSDSANDAALWVGWYDYMLVVGKLPIEAQVFQMWWYAKNENKLAPGVDPTPFRSMFPAIGEALRRTQKLLLRQAVERYTHNAELNDDPRTERESLVVSVDYS